MPDVHVTDGLVSELTDVFTAGQARLEGLVRAGLARGLDARRLGTAEQVRGDATQAYRQRQLAQAVDIINELKRTAKFAPVAIMHGYRAGLAAVDRTIGAGAGIAGTFGGTHIAAVQVLAGNLEGGLTLAANHAQRSIEDVFAAASELEGALSPRLANRGLPADFIGRRTNDPFRKAALQVIGSGTVALDTRRQVSAELARRLVRDGTTDAMTGFIDSAGKRWPLSTYASMVTRTTTREAVTRGTVNRLSESGLDLVTISSHGSSCEICADYDGNTYSLDGKTPGYDILDDQPPFHPNCGHVLTPADANLDSFERELQAAVDEPIGSPIPMASSTTAASPAASALEEDAAVGASSGGPPLSALAEPSIGPATEQAYADQAAINNLIAADPGPEAGAAEGWAKHVTKVARADNRALNSVLGPDLAKFIDRKWGKDAGVRARLLSGELSVADATEMATDEWNRAEQRRMYREIDAERNHGLESKPIPCFVCGHFKARPADICGYCGDDPVQHGGSRAAFNQAYGYSHYDDAAGLARSRGYGK